MLSRDLDRRGVYPPVNVLPSLSRLMKDGTGGEYTHPDHPALSSQLYAAYARAVQARVLASVVGEEGLAETDRRYLAFGDAFEQNLVAQEGAAHVRGEHGHRLEAARRPAAHRAHATFRRADRGSSGAIGVRYATWESLANCSRRSCYVSDPDWVASRA